VTAVSPDFSTRLLAWFDDHGRHDLPWQRDRSLYRVWVSEIMLQQTQVATVIPYFQRFMARFPDVAALAAAPLDEVLNLWTGLGYYARARNLHRAAGRVVAEHGGEFPVDFATVQELPGIGRSTAGAILAQALGQRHAILDGNVRRVLARRHLLDGDLTTSAAQARLWQLAEEMTPRQRLSDYTQAIMDLGATCCSRAKPACERCPVAENCGAQLTGRQGELPARKSARSRQADRPQRRTVMLLAMQSTGEVLLERRPESGIWGGLWCPPEFASAVEARDNSVMLLGSETWPAAPLATIHHSFTHFDLEIEPWVVQVPSRVAETGPTAAPATVWYNAARPEQVLGLPAPVKTLLGRLAANRNE
jgi:A/G-specific adenine glycosylase